MTKQEILEKSRRQKTDEGVEYMENKGRKIGFTAFCMVYIFEVIVNSLKGNDIYGISALFWTFIAAESIVKYTFSKQKSILALAIFSAVAAALSLLSFVLFVV